MLIHLDSSLITYCDLKSKKPKKIEFFELMADIRSRGFHFVTAERSLLEALGNQEKLSERSRSIFQKLFQNFTTESAIANNVGFKLRIGNFASKKEEQFIELNIEDVKENAFLNKNKLLLENSTDTTVYELITSYYFKSQSITGVHYDWDVCNGGGSTTFSEYKRITNDSSSFTYCIVDSDKISPFDDFGDTAKSFQSSKYNTFFGDYFILPVHEMENLYPEETLSALAHGDMCHSKNRVIVEKVRKDKTCNALMFLDLKKGLNKFTLHNLKGKCSEYWLSVLKKNGVNTSKCDCTDNSCNHFIFYPFGRKLSQDILRCAKKIGLEIDQTLDDVYRIIWLNIGKLLFERFCRPKMMVNF